ncbi:hypothetical protein BSL78_22164 [Apostichopus japonicus]|uniref:Uncharacterized protein n=1 Tax=Stichopus japonicus TaxID=307972 RepID=A0A2G8JYZ4_STIJA|nr:hypothetical protein BSL78_22164 [Apostichopus japonicus]
MRQCITKIAGSSGNPRASPLRTIKIYKMMIRPLFECAAPAIANINYTQTETLEASQHAESITTYIHINRQQHNNYRQPVDERKQHLRDRFFYKCTSPTHNLHQFITNQLSRLAFIVESSPLTGMDTGMWARNKQGNFISISNTTPFTSRSHHPFYRQGAFAHGPLKRLTAKQPFTRHIVSHYIASKSLKWNILDLHLRFVS